ncbi:hypothetical protein Thal_1034 [Thermocrinis albus DSM 14484]|uniref:DUF4388 domain-containing protein n=1 Tax=Thermocrinis albus (strain DSM 14484 / JCM 11386 / HI 11/12) TaxID=638303 RepID=D3SLN6_THEAH|nr:hypothetical protein [Thermocrinis albus]ADC89666.1 hypothetical protein Thal_1034 [Thermocrinis albus DSM 14484]
MISGYISSRQDLVDLVNGCLLGKNGTLDLFMGGRYISLRLEMGNITAFWDQEIQQLFPEESRPSSLLLYRLLEMLEDPQGFFTFREETSSTWTPLERPISVDELVLQLQALREEFKALMQIVMTPLAVVKVDKPFEDMNRYEGRSVLHILLTSHTDLLSGIRKLRELFGGGYLDIHQFYSPEVESSSPHLEYVLKDVEVSKVNLFTLMESLRLSKFSGLLIMRSSDGEYNLYYRKGKPVALYPYSSDLMEVLLNPDGEMRITVIGMEDSILEIFMLREVQDPLVKGLEDELVELGKVFMGMSRKGYTGLVVVHSAGKKYYNLYRKGTLTGVLVEEGGVLSWSHAPLYSRPFWVEIVQYQSVENLFFVVHLFLINLLYGVLLRRGPALSQTILTHLASSDLLMHREGNILYRRAPKEEEKEVAGFLTFLLELGHRVLGQERLEEELEVSLRPYRDVLKLLDVEEYLRLVK